MKLHVLGINLGKTVFHLVGLDGGPEPQIPKTRLRDLPTNSDIFGTRGPQ